MEIQTDIISVRSTGTPKFVQGKIEANGGKFGLYRKSDNDHQIVQTQNWKLIGVFDTLRDVIERSSEDDFFNRSIKKTQELWPKFPNGL